MPNGLDYNKEYGKHKYEGTGTSDCEYGCGCWMGPASSGGPIGVDPFGVCPGNPADGQPVGGNDDYDIVVTQRIRRLENALSEAEGMLESVKPSDIKLAQQLEKAELKIANLTNILYQIFQMSEKAINDHSD